MIHWVFFAETHETAMKKQGKMADEARGFVVAKEGIYRYGFSENGLRSAMREAVSRGSVDFSSLVDAVKQIEGDNRILVPEDENEIPQETLRRVLDTTRAQAGTCYLLARNQDAQKICEEYFTERANFTEAHFTLAGVYMVDQSDPSYAREAQSLMESWGAYKKTAEKLVYTIDFVPFEELKQ
jgi:hypothetical protein